MRLSGQQRKKLQDALIDAFPTIASLEQMLSHQLDRNLRAIAGEGSLQDIVFQLIQAAEAQGWVEDLVPAACDSNHGNPRLRATAEEVLLTPNVQHKQSNQVQKILNQLNNDDDNELKKLEILLLEQKWQQADEQTRKIVVKNNHNSLLRSHEIRQISLDLLNSIDQLWIDNSDGKFGLRIQQQLWKKIIEPEKQRFSLNLFAKKVKPPITDSQAWIQFGCLVGWRSDDEKLFQDAKLDFSIKAPSGCFPRTRLWLLGGYGNIVKQFVALMERVAQLE